MANENIKVCIPQFKVWEKEEKESLENYRNLN